jgi:transposase
MKRNLIVLSAEQRTDLERFSKTGVRSTKLVNRARIILALDTANDKKASRQSEIAQRLGISRQTVNNARRDFLAAGSHLDFLQRKKRETPPVKPKVTGELEARIIALACSEAPRGYSKWTLRLIAEKSVELCYIDALSHMTVSRLLKKHNLSLT